MADNRRADLVSISRGRRQRLGTGPLSSSDVPLPAEGADDVIFSPRAGPLIDTHGHRNGRPWRRSVDLATRCRPSWPRKVAFMESALSSLLGKGGAAPSQGRDLYQQRATAQPVIRFSK